MSEWKDRAELIRRISDEVRLTIGEKSPESDEEIRRLIESYIFEAEYTAEMNFKQKISLVNGVFNAMRKDMDLLQPYMEDELVNEIMVNGKDNIFIERAGSLIRIDEVFS